MSGRVPGWRNRLADYVARVARAGFRPGVHDCALFAAGGVEAITGVHPAPDLVRAYRTLEDGMALLEARGHADHIAFTASILPEVAPLSARAGDLAVIEETGALCLGIVQGPRIYVLRPAGLGLVLITSAQRAFRV